MSANGAWNNANGQNNPNGNRHEDSGLQSGFSRLDINESSRLSSWVSNDNPERRSQTAPPGLSDTLDYNPGMGAFSGMQSDFNSNNSGLNSWGSSGNGNFGQIPQYNGSFGGFQNNGSSNFGGTMNYNNNNSGQYMNQYNNPPQHASGYPNMGGNFNGQPQGNFNNLPSNPNPPAPQSWDNTNRGDGAIGSTSGAPPLPHVSGKNNGSNDAAAKRYQQLQQQAMRWMQQQMQSEGLGNIPIEGMGNFNVGGQIDSGTKGPTSTANNNVKAAANKASNNVYVDNNNKGSQKRRPDTKGEPSAQPKSSDNNQKSGVRSFADIASSSQGKISGVDKPAQWPSLRSSNGIPQSVKNPPSKSSQPQTSPVATARTLQTVPSKDTGNSRGSHRGVAGANASSSSSSNRLRTEAKYYQVEFRAPRRDIFVGYDDHFKIGDLVKVEADRGEDLGTLIHMWNAEDFADWLAKQSGSSSRATSSKYHKRMLRLATEEEKEKLPRKQLEEEAALELCRSKAEQRKLPMQVVSAEYQFDRHKLTFYFEAERRIDFRELVRDLFAIYKTRIWLQQMSAVAMASAAPGAPRDTQRKLKKPL